MAMVCFAVFAYEYYEKSVKPLAITFAALALLFQPFAKIALGRTMWNVSLPLRYPSTKTRIPIRVFKQIFSKDMATP